MINQKLIFDEQIIVLVDISIFLLYYTTYYIENLKESSKFKNLLVASRSLYSGVPYYR